jgi:hypothetical protein
MSVAHRYLRKEECSRHMRFNKTGGLEVGKNKAGRLTRKVA